MTEEDKIEAGAMVREEVRKSAEVAMVKWLDRISEKLTVTNALLWTVIVLLSGILVFLTMGSHG